MATQPQPQPQRTERHVATVVLEAGRNEVLLLRRSSKVRSCQNLWACVSGSVEKGENSLQAARRELAEETKLTPQCLSHSLSHNTRHT